MEEQYIEDAAPAKRKTKKPLWIKWGAVAACLCLAVAGAVAVLPKINHIPTAGIEGGGKQTQSEDSNDGSTYSVAVLPADRPLDDVQNASCERISEEEMRHEAGLRDYVPSKLPDGYHFDLASLYVTTLKDGTVYKMLMITYGTGEAPEPSTDQEGSACVQNPDNLRSEFRVYIYNFKPDTKDKIYSYLEQYFSSYLK